MSPSSTGFEQSGSFDLTIRYGGGGVNRTQQCRLQANAQWNGGGMWNAAESMLSINGEANRLSSPIISHEFGFRGWTPDWVWEQGEVVEGELPKSELCRLSEDLWKRMNASDESALATRWAIPIREACRLEPGLTDSEAWTRIGLPMFFRFSSPMKPMSGNLVVHSDSTRRVYWIEDDRGRVPYRKTDPDTGLTARFRVYWSWIGGQWVVVR